MGKSFKNITVCAIGKFGENTDKIPLWMNANGGSYAKNLNDSVTHLVISEDAYKENGEIVSTAKGMENVKIVSYDWLEDSLQSKSRRPKGEKDYLWTNILKNEAKKKQTKAADGKKGQGDLKIKKGDNRKTRKKPPLSATKKLQTKGYLPYLSPETGVSYFAKLVRKQSLQESGQRHARQPVKPGARKETYTVKMWQCKDSPQKYALVVRHSKIGKCVENFLVPPGSSYDKTMASFKSFFKEKTGVAWEDRYSDYFLSPSSGDDYEFNRPRGLMAELVMSRERQASDQQGTCPDTEPMISTEMGLETHMPRDAGTEVGKCTNVSQQNCLLSERGMRDELKEGDDLEGS